MREHVLEESSWKQIDHEERRSRDEQLSAGKLNRSLCPIHCDPLLLGAACKFIRDA
ncbi:hypothetical protein WH47_04913 [Habropoda laboriosa]|uniref:Uncharacterized protein n=1 Tax=Habropoda laboriosa TaxID=597456 RepID=A0A0L7RIZ9_9HYME|nr:hypothetical protein WH47_04913 [Habropoda laboriosa]